MGSPRLSLTNKYNRALKSPTSSGNCVISDEPAQLTRNCSAKHEIPFFMS